MPLPKSAQSILVLDDDVIMRGLLQALLAVEGYSVSLAPSGEEGLDLLQNGHTFDVLLSDVQMPGLAGGTLAERLREAIPQATLLIGMSGTEPPEATRELFDAFLLKPFSVQLLRDTVISAETQKLSRNHHTQGRHDPSQSADPERMPPLDAKIFGSLASMIPPAKVSDLFAMALTDIEKRHKRIEEAAAEGDLITVQREAHAIKGSCGMIGASELHHLAAAIEDGTTVNTSAIEEIPRACDRLKRMLETKLHTV